MLNSIVLLMGITLMYSAPLVFGALGGVVSERAGVVNIGIEGMMTIGAFTGAAVGYYSGIHGLDFWQRNCRWSNGFITCSASVTFNADQTVSGIAINLLGPGFALFL